MNPDAILWGYIVLLVIGGVAGFLKARSKASLIASLVFATLLSLSALGYLGPPYVADIILLVLLLFFAGRFSKSKKLIPGGVLVVLTIAALLLRNVF